MSQRHAAELARAKELDRARLELVRLVQELEAIEGDELSFLDGPDGPVELRAEVRRALARVRVLENMGATLGELGELGPRELAATDGEE
jgi:hypothetical protein